MAGRSADSFTNFEAQKSFHANRVHIHRLVMPGMVSWCLLHARKIPGRRLKRRHHGPEVDGTDTVFLHLCAIITRFAHLKRECGSSWKSKEDGMPTNIHSTWKGALSVQRPASDGRRSSRSSMKARGAHLADNASKRSSNGSLISRSFVNDRSDRSTPPCLLLQLPAEVRQAIFRYVIPTSLPGQEHKFYTDCDTAFTDDKWQSHRPKRAPQKTNAASLAILRTNSTIYREALAVLYSTTTFHFIGSNYLPILDFFRRLSPEAKLLVRKIRITWLGTFPQGAQFHLFCMAVLDFLPGLISFDSGPWIWF